MNDDEWWWIKSKYYCNTFLVRTQLWRRTNWWRDCNQHHLTAHFLISRNLTEEIYLTCRDLNTHSHRETKTDWFCGLRIYFKPSIWALWLTFGIYELVGRKNNFTFNNHKTMVCFWHPGIFHGNLGVIDKILRVFVSEYFQLYITWHKENRWSAYFPLLKDVAYGSILIRGEEYLTPSNPLSRNTKHMKYKYKTSWH